MGPSRASIDILSPVLFSYKDNHRLLRSGDAGARSGRPAGCGLSDRTNGPGRPVSANEALGNRCAIYLHSVSYGLPGVESAREIGDLAEPSAAQDARGDGTPIPAFAMNYQKFLAVQFSSSRGQLPQRNPNRVLHGARLDFSGFPDVEHRDVVLFLLQQLRELMDRNLRDVIQLEAALNPTGDSVFQVCLHVLDPDARQAQLGLPQMIPVLSDQDDALIQAQDSSGPGRILPGESDMHGARNMRDCELHRRTRIEDDRAFRLQAEDFGRLHRHRRRKPVQRCGALPVQLHVAAEVLGPGRQVVSEKMDELLAGTRLKSIIRAALLPDRGRALGTHLPPA